MSWSESNGTREESEQRQARGDLVILGAVLWDRGLIL